MKILSIQGSRREIDEEGNSIPFEISDKVGIMEKYGDKVITPVARWYSNPSLFNTVNAEIKKQKIDAIVGNSAGGYLAFYLSNFHKIPALMLNPALASSSEAPKIQAMPQEYCDASIFNKQMALVGNRDLKIRWGVDFHLTLEFFQSKDFFKVGNKMFMEEGMSHWVPNDIFEKYFDKFYNTYLK